MSILLLVRRLLNDAVLGFLALVTLFVGLAFAVFDPTPATARALGAVELAVVALFAVEYAVSLSLARAKLAFARNPWRVLDALIVLAGVLSLVPAVHDALRSSPALRLIRLGRFVLLGARSSAALTVRSATADRPGAWPPAEVTVHAFAAPSRFERVDWEALLQRVGSEDEDWLFASGVRREQLAPIAAALGVPEVALYSKLFDATFPRIDQMERFTALFAWYPALQPTAGDGALRPTRTGVLLVGSAHNVVVLTRGQTDLLAAIEQRLPETEPSVPPLVRATFALLREILRAYGRVLEDLEGSLVQIEAAQTTMRDREFLDRTFRLRGETTRVRGSLRHLKDVIRDLAERRSAIKGFDAAHRPLFALLADEAADLYETVDDLGESLGALVDLRLNVSSFQMNKVMRLLALLTTLALLPSVAGGMLGMNLTDAPWSATLPQVAFGLAAGMALSLYVFGVRGWLR